MLPFKDNVPSRRYPYFTVSIIAANVAVFVYELSLKGNLDGLLIKYGVVPVKVVYTIKYPSILSLEHVIISIFTSMFLHGGWFHILGNMWYLWLFGDNVEDRLGHYRFFLFYLICGLGAAAAQIAVNPELGIPTIGASGAVAGVLGGYLVTFPTAKIRTIIPIWFFWDIIELPAILVLGFWFVVQLLNATLTLGHSYAGGIAWWAHIGGFIVGMALMKILDRGGVKPWYTYMRW